MLKRLSDFDELRTFTVDGTKVNVWIRRYEDTRKGIKHVHISPTF